MDELAQIAKSLVAPGKGIWAADATAPSMEKRFTAAGITATDETRRSFREILFKIQGLGEFISGIIMNDETIRQKATDGTLFTDLIKAQGIIIGIKVDKGVKDMAGFPGEKISEGLDGLRERLVEYKEMGAKFTKWRAVITIGDGIPTQTCINSNSEALARFAALSQEGGFVPVVEPEVLMDGSHNLERSSGVITATLQSLFQKLNEHKVKLEGLLLKSSLAHHGKESGEKATDEQVAQATIEVLKRCVPKEVPGVVFLSGGDEAKEATSHLDLINEKGPHPWSVGFSFERALEGPAMEIWRGDNANAEAAQKELYKRARMNSLARSGQYKAEMENKDNG